MTTVVSGALCIQAARLHSWIAAAKLHMAGIGPKHATLAKWREQTGHSARYWRQVGAKATQMVEELDREIDALRRERSQINTDLMLGSYALDGGREQLEARLVEIAKLV